MEILKTLGESHSEDWLDALSWLGWSVLTGLMPLWATPILLKLFQQAVSLPDIMSRGEFVLYAASFSGAALYFVMRDFRKTAFPSRSALGLLLVSLLLINTLVFAGVTVAYGFGATDTSKFARLVVDPGVLATVSWIGLPLSALLGFTAVVAGNVMAGVDPQKKRKRDLDSLQKDFDELA